MRLQTAKVALEIFVLTLLVRPTVFAQSPSATLSGTITFSGASSVKSSRPSLADVSISIRNVATAQVTTTHADATGKYSVAGLPAGNYEFSASANGFGAQTATVTLAPGARQTVDLTLTAGSASGPALSLGDLGFAVQDTTGSAAEQARLDRRSPMLKWHQRFGLITAVRMVAALVTAGHAGRRGTPSGRRLHAELGGLTAGLYATTASLAIFAPKIEGTKTEGPIRVHRTLAWIHGTGMILTPILEAMEYQQLNRGERVHGVAQAHGAVAAVTVIAYGR